MYLLNRIQRHRVNYTWMIVSLLLVASLPFLLFLGLYLKSFLLIHDYHLGDLLFSKVWKPGSGRFGFYPFIVGSIWVTLLAMFISAPVSLLTAIYVTQYTRKDSFGSCIRQLISLPEFLRLYMEYGASL